MAVTAARTRQPRRRHATTAHGVSAHTRRRTSLTSSIVLLSAASTAVQPAFAGLFGGGKEAADEAYTSMTSDIIAEVRTTLALPKDDETKGPAVEKLRGDTNMWVARYRRDQAYSGRISYSNMYSALNAIAGHYNSFGTSYPLPKKRLDRIIQECEVAEKALARGR